MKLGIIGCGRFGEKRALVAAKELGLNVVAISRRNQSEAQRIANQFDIEHTFIKTEDLLPHVDAVWITSPHDLHEHDAILCAKAGLPTLCEKPLALSEESAKRIEAAFTKVPLLIGHHLRYKWAVHKAREMITTKKLGDLQHIKVHYSISLDPSSWKYQVGGVLQDLGVHLIDLVRYLVGEEITVVKTHGDEKTAHMLLEFTSGITAMLCCSFVYAFANSFELFGTKGRLVSENSLRQTFDPIETLCHIQEDDSRLYFPLRAENPYVDELRHFIEICEGKALPLVPASVGVANARIIDLC